MKDAPKLSDMNLARLINRLSEGRFEIPNFQRKFVWKADQINDLMRSIFCDYYIGSLLLWKGSDDNFNSLSCKPISGYEGNGDREHIVLDGQQRLSAIYYAFFSPDEKVPKTQSRGFFFIRIDRFIEEEFEDAFEYRLAHKHPLTKREEQFQNHCFPLSILGEESRVSRVRYDWLEEYGKHWKLQETDAVGAANDRDAARYRQYQNYGDQFEEIIDATLLKYMISYTELDRNIGTGKICSIFTKINSTGTRLDTFNLLNAMLTPKEIYLKQMWDDAIPRLEFVKAPRLNTYVLRVMSILRQQGHCSPKYLYDLVPGENRLIADKDDFMQRWHRAVSAIEEAIKILSDRQEFGAITSRFLPYPAIIPAFAALQESARSQKFQLNALQKVRHWYWASVFTERYSRAVESITARDYRDVCAWIEGGSAPDVIGDFQKAVQNLNLRGTTSQVSAVYRGIINLVVLSGAKDWISGDRPTAEGIDDHHIVPQSWGKRKDLNNSINTVLNRTLLSEETNRTDIRSRLPNEYLPELMIQYGEERIRTIFESHLISHKAFDILLRAPFERADFDEFITERQRTILSAIGRLLSEDRLEIEPDLRKMDESIRDIELALRTCIADALAGDVHLLPSDPLIRAEQQITQYLKTNPSADHEQHSKTLMGKLEHFDLRGLQQVLTNKGLWDRFEPRFKTKELLNQRFEQLTGLRNPLAHSRPLGEVSRLEGEAAIKWFQKILELEN